MRARDQGQDRCFSSAQSSMWRQMRARRTRVAGDASSVKHGAELARHLSLIVCLLGVVCRLSRTMKSWAGLLLVVLFMLLTLEVVCIDGALEPIRMGVVRKERVTKRVRVSSYFQIVGSLSFLFPNPLLPSEPLLSALCFVALIRSSERTNSV